MSPKTPSHLERILRSGRQAVTSECGPPRGSDASHIVHKAELIRRHVDAINITDNQTSVCRLCSLAACIRLKLMGLEPVLQMVVRDRNRIALQSDLLGAAAFDIHNVLCLSGDHQRFGDSAQGQNVFDIDSMQLVQTVRRMRDEGRFLGGLILPGFGLMLKALEMGTAGLKFPTGDVVDFPTNTSDALMSGGANAIAGAIERQHRRLTKRTGQEPLLFMSGGAAVKLAPMTDLKFETVDTLIFEGLLLIQSHRLAL